MQDAKDFADPKLQRQLSVDSVVSFLNQRRASEEGRFGEQAGQDRGNPPSPPVPQGQQGLVYSTSGALKAALLKQLSGKDSPSFSHAAAAAVQVRI